MRPTLFTVSLTLMLTGCCARGGLGANYPNQAVDVLEGRASYYHDRFHGRCTANGDRYDRRAFTAASRDLPFGTVLRVHRVGADLAVIIRINDRGPFRDHSRILDLSRAAAESLNMVRAGVVPIRAEVLRLGDGSRHRCR